MRKERHDMAFITGAVVGGLAAAAVTLLRAPQAGARTRAQIAERLEPVTSKTSELSRTVANQSRSLTDQSAARSRGLTTTIRSKVQREDQVASERTDEFVVVEPLGTSDLEPLPAANAVPPVPAEEVAAAADYPAQPDQPAPNRL